MSKKELRLGVIGVGNRGALARHAHKPSEGSRLVAGYDPNPEAIKEFKEFLNDDCTIANSVEELVALDLDGVFICSPDFCHEEQALLALNAKIPVYCEKPLAITIDGCDAILKAAKDNNTELYVGHNMRHMPFVKEMKRIIDEGQIGRVCSAWCRHFISYGGDCYFRDWHSEQKYGTSLLLQKGAHDIDVLHYLCGGYTERVTAMGKLDVYDKCERRDESEVGGCRKEGHRWPPLEQGGFSPKIDMEDHNMVLMQLNNGVQASYMQSHYTPDSMRNYTIIGTEGRIENFGDYNPGSTIRVWRNRTDKWSLDADYTVDVQTCGSNHGGADMNIIKDFLLVLREGKDPEVPSIAARNAVAVGCAAAESLRNGNIPITIAPIF